ncbi:MAG: hypothetical protein KDB50_08515 [Mycobacterium sp.]|nr:hypothetical protein [Mycobacterium sp.]
MGRLRGGAVAVVALAAVLGTGGCSRAIGGTPVAAPGDLGVAALLSTTCREYTAMKPSSRLEVITAIGADGNEMVATNPSLWVGVATALCSFVAPSAPVRDVISGGLR